ncbi:hypothetical protein [uncultured Campylobacter sp.]|uniref:hypothetical protein n=1 Tax=uncultured Campylobacter sp. TaxID=218934 RepID=UPI0026041836|nr:hypothetical protein [uncultured Campylobacter sp.]
MKQGRGKILQRTFLSSPNRALSRVKQNFIAAWNPAWQDKISPCRRNSAEQVEFRGGMNELN